MNIQARMFIIIVLGLTWAIPSSAQQTNNGQINRLSQAVVEWADSIVPDSIPLQVALPIGERPIELGVSQHLLRRLIPRAQAGVSGICGNTDPSGSFSHCRWPHRIQGTYYDFSGGVVLWIEKIDRGKEGSVEVMVRMMWVPEAEVMFPDWELLSFRFYGKGDQLALTSVESVATS